MGWRNIILVPEPLLKLGILIGSALPLPNHPIVVHTTGLLVAEDAMMIGLPLPLYFAIKLISLPL